MLQILFLSVLSWADHPNRGVDRIRVPEFLVGHWIQISRQEDIDIFDIKSDGTLVQELTRAVPTYRHRSQVICRIKRESDIVGVKSASMALLDDLRGNRKPDAESEMTFRVYSVDLLTASDRDECAEYVDQQNRRARSRDGLFYTWGFTDLRDDTIFDPWNTMVFAKID